MANLSTIEEALSHIAKGGQVIVCVSTARVLFFLSQLNTPAIYTRADKHYALANSTFHSLSTARTGRCG